MIKNNLMKFENVDIENMYNYLVKKYNKATITKKELAIEISMSVSSIDKFIMENKNIPKYRKIGNGKNSKVLFNVLDVAKFLYSDLIQVNIIDHL